MGYKTEKSFVASVPSGIGQHLFEKKLQYPRGEVYYKPMPVGRLKGRGIGQAAPGSYTYQYSGPATTSPGGVQQAQTFGSTIQKALNVGMIIALGVGLVIVAKHGIDIFGKLKKVAE